MSIRTVRHDRPDNRMPQTGYTIRNIYVSGVPASRGNAYSFTELVVRVEEPVNPQYLREDFASHLSNVLKILEPSLEFKIDELVGGQVLTVTGFTGNTAPVLVNIASGKEGGSVVLRSAVAGKEVLRRYRRTLEIELSGN